MAWPGEPFHDSRFRHILREGGIASPSIEGYIRALTQAQQERPPEMETMAHLLHTSFHTQTKTTEWMCLLAYLQERRGPALNLNIAPRPVTYVDGKQKAQYLSSAKQEGTEQYEEWNNCDTIPKALKEYRAKLSTIKSWQMLAAATILAGQDCFTITATASGKSFCYQLVTMHEHHSVILVICPLVALMDEQVLSATRLGIKAAAIHAEQLERSPELLKEIKRGEYQIVFAGPEFCVPGEERWMQLTTDCAFSDNLRCVVVDELSSFMPPNKTLRTNGPPKSNASSTMRGLPRSTCPADLRTRV